MFSQNDEERWILGAFGDRPGRFLDIGAYDGRTFSNTRALLDRGWSGVGVEPSPVPLAKLREEWAGKPTEILDVALALYDGEVEWYDCGGDAISTFDQAHRDKWAAGAGVKYQAMKVRTVSWATLLARVGTDFDFLNLDVEGVSAALFLAAPLERLTKCRLICVEHDGQIQAILDRGAKLGYGLVTSNGENVILSR